MVFQRVPPERWGAPARTGMRPLPVALNFPGHKCAWVLRGHWSRPEVARMVHLAA